ncbi:MAG TPA: protein kinase [Planctomycetota bacterium]|nr:protein kinase [Planctomycetota bacterium]
MFGRYRLLGKLGEGGMGVVYLAEDTSLGRKVALKTIRAEVADKTARERLRREARAAAAVSHPNVCQVYEVGEEGGETFLAMELLEGEPLASRLAKGPMPLRDALEAAIAILGALDALHGQGIVHRDLKPSNVFLTAHGVKLLDFGLALPMEAGGSGGQRLTQTGFFVGTPGYMAPEQWTGEEVGPRTDVFAVGAMLVEMVAGARAFRGDRAADLMHAVLHDQPPSLTGGPAAQAVDRVVQRALSKRADERPAAGAMADELRAALALAAGGERPAAVHIHRMVVVPFRLLRPDAEIDFLPLGLSDALTTSLRGIEGLSVLSSQVGAKHAGDALDPRLVAETGAELALAGTIQRAGSRLRVHAELVEVPDGRVAWSKTAEGSTDDVFRLQDDLARLIVDSLALELTPGRRRALRQDVPANAKAYELFLRANQISYNFGMLSAARDLYRACLAEDPGFAPAWARLGRVCRVMAKYGHGDPVADLAEAETAFRRSLELNPELPIAHNLFAYHEIEELGRSKEAMVRLLEQARRAPTDAELWAGLVVACRFCGLLDASLEADRKARRLDPGIRTSVTYTHWMRGNYEMALRYDDEDLGWTHCYSLPLMGRSAEAAEVSRERERRSPHALERSVLASDRAAIEGNRGECLAATRAVLASSFHDPEGRYFGARNLVHVGEIDLGLEALGRVCARGFCIDQAIERDPWLEPVRGDPRYAQAVATARAGRLAATDAYRAAGGESLLGGTGFVSKE